MRQSKDFTFSNGNSLVVWQANYDMDVDREAIEETAQALRVKANGSGNPEKLFFHEVIYPGLAAYSVGNVPNVDDAFLLSDTDLDNWHLLVSKLNPGRYLSTEYKQKEIKLGDRSITVLSNRPSVLMRRIHLEDEVGKLVPLDNPKRQNFRVIFYPKMAGCSLNAPTETEARQDLSGDELQLWYETCAEMIPAWFKLVEENAEQNQEQDRKKKRNRHPVKS